MRSAFREAEAEISLSALRANYRFLRALASPARLICVVKADAYGHGAVRVAQALISEGADFFAVARLSEALTLRRAGIGCDILILAPGDPREANRLSSLRLTQTVGSLAYAKALDEAANGTPVSIQIKLDCGMGRLGFPIADPASAAAVLAAARLPSLLPTGVFSHLPTSDDPLDGGLASRMQGAVVNFHKHLASSGLKLPLHLYSSAGLLRFGYDSAFAFMRPGIALYGYPPSEALSCPALTPVLNLSAPILQVRALSVGETVGYGCTYRAEKPLTAVLLGIGYADGLPRAASGGIISVGGMPALLAGRVSMDLSVAVLPAGVRPSPEARAVLFGDSPAALPALAGRAGTIPYELLSRITARVRRGRPVFRAFWRNARSRGR